MVQKRCKTHCRHCLTIEPRITENRYLVRGSVILVNKCIPPQGITLEIWSRCRQILGPSTSQQSQVKLLLPPSVDTIVTVTWRDIFLFWPVIRGLWLGVVLTYWSTFARVDLPTRLYSPELGAHLPLSCLKGVPDVYYFLCQVGNKLYLFIRLGETGSTSFGTPPSWERLSHPHFFLQKGWFCLTTGV